MMTNDIPYFDLVYAFSSFLFVKFCTFFNQYGWKLMLVARGKADYAHLSQTPGNITVTRIKSVCHELYTLNGFLIQISELKNTVKHTQAVLS